MPGDAPELMDGLMATTDVYRKRYGYKRNLFDLDGGDVLVSTHTHSLSLRLS